MRNIIHFALDNWYAVVVLVLTVAVLGALALLSIPVDILPVNRSPANQVLTFYSGMPAALVEKSLSNRLERWTGQAAGTVKQESRSIIGVSIVRNYYRDDVDPQGALTQVESLVSAATPYLPPGTLPPIVMPYDPTSVTPVCLIALDNPHLSESVLADIGRYEVRNMVMSIHGVVAPVVFGGKARAVLAFMNREKMQARNLAPQDLLAAIRKYNVFLPAGVALIGKMDYALDSNAMYALVEKMGNIPVKTEGLRTVFLKDVATVKDSHLPQISAVRVNGRREVYVPIYRQTGASTLAIVSDLKRQLPDIQTRLSYPATALKLVMDQSIYVRQSIYSLILEGVLGTVLCALVILLFLGQWRMTLIAVLTIPIAVLASILGLNLSGNTINVMTLAGLALAIGPLVDSAIICLENTERHLGFGTHPKEAALYGTSEVALPALVASLCTLLVLAPLALMPGLGRFLFRPMALAVAFAMISAFILALSFVPAMCALWLRGHEPRDGPHHGRDYEHRQAHEQPAPRSWLGRLYEKWSDMLNKGFAWYGVVLRAAIAHRGAVLGGTALLWILVVLGVTPWLRREFFPEVDAGAFEIAVRAPSGTRLEETEKRVAAVEQAVRKATGPDLEMIISEMGVVADWSAAYTPNAGSMDAVVKVQLKPERSRSAQQYVEQLREGFAGAPAVWGDLDFAFDAGGMIRSAMNEGKASPLNIRITTRNVREAYPVAAAILKEVRRVPGIVDARILQRLDYPEYFINVDQAKAADLGLSSMDVLRNLIATFNSSIQYNKTNYWIDPITTNQYYVGVMYPESRIRSLNSLLDVLVTNPAATGTRKRSIPLRNMATLTRQTVASEATHRNLQTTLDLTLGVHGRDLGHVADDVQEVLNQFGQPEGGGLWQTYAPAKPGTPLVGSKIHLSGEYARMQETFHNLGAGLVLASLLIYFLMVALFRSWLTPLVVLSAVPVGLIGVVLMLLCTQTAINVQSLLGVIFMVGIVVSNTVLLVDFAQNVRQQDHLSPTEAMLKAASIRVRPVVMTALAAFFALLPMALSLERGSEANAPLGRAVIGGLVAGLVTTLIVVPCVYSWVVRDA